jgi:hypothetical protein
MTLSPNSFTLLLLCSSLAPGDETSGPLSGREWSGLVRALQAALLTPADLLSPDARRLRRPLNLDISFASRLARLFSRRAELERLARAVLHRRQSAWNCC